MQVADKMTPNPITITPRDTLATARGLMERGRFRALPVVENGALVGILSDRDLRQHEGYLELTKVTAAMNSDAVTVSPESSVLEAARLIVAHKIGSLPVMAQGKLVGIVTTSDLLRALVDVIRATEGVLAD